MLGTSLLWRSTVTFTYLNVQFAKSAYVYFRWSWSCYFGLGLKNLVLFSSLAAFLYALYRVRLSVPRGLIIHTKFKNRGFVAHVASNWCTHFEVNKSKVKVIGTKMWKSFLANVCKYRSFTSSPNQNVPLYILRYLLIKCIRKNSYFSR